MTLCATSISHGRRSLSALLIVRALPRRVIGRRPAPRTLTLEDLTRAGFVVLVDRPAEELVLGLVGRFWRVTGDIRSVEADRFDRSPEPGFARTAWNFAIEKRGAESSVVITQTRVVCTDGESRRKFLRYWKLVGPFSALIRRRLLELIKRHAERLPRAGSG